MMFILGLTGSIGMGKSVTAGVFARCGISVHDADAAVHRLYGGDAVGAIAAAFPGIVTDGVVDRAALGARVLENPPAMATLERIVHPLVQQSQRAFLAAAQARGERTVVLDIPLLFETDASDRVDAVVVVSAPLAVQRARVLARPGMSDAKLTAILLKQMPDVEKRRRAHFVVDSSRGVDSVERQVCGILRAVAGLPGRRN
jgi:dephospho-CoA kinase